LSSSGVVFLCVILLLGGKGDVLEGFCCFCVVEGFPSFYLSISVVDARVGVKK